MIFTPDAVSRREFLRGSIATSLLSMLPASGLFAEKAASTDRPNVLFLFSDQHHAGMTGYAGHPNVRTPALDRLAAGGMCFERAYCQDGVCLPSRTSLITGHYPRTLGTYDNSLLNQQIFEASTLSSMVPIQRVFHQAGYRTFTAGKRHVLPSMDTDWDYSAGALTPGQWPSEAHDTLNYWTWIRQQGLMDRMLKDWNCEFGKNPEPFTLALSSLPPEATMEAFTARQTIEFLRSSNAKKTPFFAWSTFYRPHQPYTPQRKYVDQIDFASIRLPASLHQDPNDLPPYLCHIRNSTKKAWDCAEMKEADYRRYIGYYIALVHEIDAHIHSILDVLEQEGLAENTIVIYSSDHGDFVGNHGLPEKQAGGHNFYEETLRVPLVIRNPGKTIEGAVCRDLVELIDLYPTLLDLCGIRAPKTSSLPGRSLAETLRRRKPVGRNYVVSENWSQAAVITDRFKYGQWLNSPDPRADYRKWGNMLTERAGDPNELTNIARVPERGAIVKQMEAYLTEWVDRVDDSGRVEYFSKRNAPYSKV